MRPVKLADCPVFPDEAGNALSTDRGLGWRLARQAGPVLRHSAENPAFANWVFVVGRQEVLANLDDPKMEGTRALPERDLEAHRQLFAPKAAHDIAMAFRPTIAALIDRFVAAAGGDAVAEVTTPMANALFDIVSRLQLLPVEHLNGQSGRVFLEACRNLSKHAGWHVFELARRPELCDMLRREPELIRGFVEEVLRLEPMVPICQRFTTRPTTVGEVELPVGVVVMLCIGAVQRDGSDGIGVWARDPCVAAVGTSSGRRCACWSRSGSTGPRISGWFPISGRSPSSRRLRRHCGCRDCRW
jgi:hypothetical protein